MERWAEQVVNGWQGGGGATGKQRVKGGREASADFGFRGAGRVPSEGLGNSGGEAQ